MIGRTIPKEMDLIIRKLAWNFISKSNSRMIEYQDLVQEGTLAYYHALETYNSNKGTQLSTWVWINVKNALIDFLQKYSKQEEDVSDFTNEIYYFDSNFDVDELRRILSINSKKLLDFILSHQELFCNNKPRKNRGLLYRKLREQGWKWNEIWESFNEMKLKLVEV